MTMARIAAVQALYQMEVGGASAEAVMHEMTSGRLPAAEEGPADSEVDQPLFRLVVESAVAEQGRIDTEIAKSLAENWKLERIDSVARAILRAAVVELWGRDTPTAVVINEYVEIAKDFFEGSGEPGFINAALEATAKRIRETGPAA
jgi:N utilization substance protein B